MIDFLEDDEIFVFGSNIEGKHGSGAARDALKWGAIYGVPFGRQGQTYAIATKDIRDNSFVGWNYVTTQLITLIHYARSFPNLKFLLTPIATGLAGQTIEELEEAIKYLEFPSNVIKIWEND